LEASDLKVNNASLTGENVDIKLGLDANSENLYEAKNVARMGCNFTSGNGTAVNILHIYNLILIIKFRSFLQLEIILSLAKLQKLRLQLKDRKLNYKLKSLD
jgi:hypothetical protein